MADKGVHLLKPLARTLSGCEGTRSRGSLRIERNVSSFLHLLAKTCEALKNLLISAKTLGWTSARLAPRTGTRTQLSTQRAVPRRGPGLCSSHSHICFCLFPGGHLWDTTLPRPEEKRGEDSVVDLSKDTSIQRGHAVESTGHAMARVCSHRCSVVGSVQNQVPEHAGSVVGSLHPGRYTQCHQTTRGRGRFPRAPYPGRGPPLPAVPSHKHTTPRE